MSVFVFVCCFMFCCCYFFVYLMFAWVRRGHKRESCINVHKEGATVDQVVTAATS